MGGGLREGRCRLAGRLRLRGDDLPRSSSGGLLRERSLFDAESRVHRAGRRLRPASVLRAEATTRPTARLSQRLSGMNHIPGRFAPPWTSTTGIPAASTAGMPPPPRMLWRVTCASATLMCLCLGFCLLYAVERLLARVGHLAWAFAVPKCVRGAYETLGPRTHKYMPTRLYNARARA